MSVSCSHGPFTIIRRLPPTLQNVLSGNLRTAIMRTAFGTHTVNANSCKILKEGVVLRIYTSIFPQSHFFLYPSIRVRTAPSVSVRVRVSVSFSFTVLCFEFV